MPFGIVEGYLFELAPITLFIVKNNETALIFPKENSLSPLSIRWHAAATGVVILIILLRLVYFGLAQLIPDEAYYWQYAQHMDLSFFDHPPMVAWLIWLGTSILGNNEFGVRIGAFICGLLSMGYLYALARNLYDKATGMRALMLWAVLPFGFASGLLMTPDAPLVATWTATLYYMERALVFGQRSAWLGMGIAFGLGLLSKYSLGLLGVAALIFVIMDPTARRWMKQPHPYFSAFLALLIFSPVILWNYQNNWVSFMFQSDRLLSEEHEFSVHYLTLYILILLTPVGFLAAAVALFSSEKHDGEKFARRRQLFVKVFTGVPLFIFFALSTFDLPKFHWTGPVWLSLLPTIAWMMGQASFLNTMNRRLQTAWRPTIIGCILCYVFVLNFLAVGIPGIRYPKFAEHYFWRETAIEIEKITEEVQQQTGKIPIVVGMSKWSVASALSFYNQGQTAMDIRSQNIFGESAVMYDFWFPSQERIARPIIQVGMKRHHLEHNRTGKIFSQMLDNPGEIKYRIINRDGIPMRFVYYRVASGFLGADALGD